MDAALLIALVVAVLLFPPTKAEKAAASQQLNKAYQQENKSIPADRPKAKPEV